MSTNIPSGIYRRELWVDANDIQSEKEDGTQLTAEEYLEALATRGNEKLAENQLVKSFEATVRTLNPTYQYGVDFFLGDKITVTDERIGITVDAIVQGVQRGVSQEGETMSLILGYEQPTVFEKLRRKAEK